MKNLINGEAIEVLCHNSATNKNEWKKGNFISYCPATDMDYRIECKLESGQHLQGITAAHPDCVRSVKLNSVIVHFADSQYDYETSVSAATTEESAKKYFVGASFNMASYPKELFKKCVNITFMDNNKIENTKEFKLRFEARPVNSIGNIYNFSEKVKQRI